MPSPNTNIDNELDKILEKGNYENHYYSQLQAKQDIKALITAAKEEGYKQAKLDLFALNDKDAVHRDLLATASNEQRRNHEN